MLHNPARMSWSEAELGVEAVGNMELFLIRIRTRISRAAARDTARILLANGKLSLGRG